MPITRPITAAQIKTIHAIARTAGMDSDTLHAYIKQQTGVDSIKALTSQQAGRAIDRLKDKVGQAKPQAFDRATVAQIKLILALSRELGWDDDPARLRAWLEARYGVSHPRYLTDAKTQGCISALRAMIKGGRGERRATDAATDTKGVAGRGDDRQADR